MNHLDELKQLPKGIREIFQSAESEARRNLSIVEDFFGSQRVFYAHSHSGRSQFEQAYENDGNTQTNGTLYSWAWFDMLTPTEPEFRYKYSSRYHGSYERCVVHAIDVTVRDRDRKIVRAYGEVGVGLYGGMSPERIYNGFHGATVKLPSTELCTLIEQISTVRRRVDIELAVDKMLPR